MKNVQVHGIGFFGTLFIVLLIIKLVKPEALDWGWVFAPFWIPIGLFFAIFLIGTIIVSFLPHKK